MNGNKDFFFIDILKWEDIHSYQKKGWVFRGQREPKWKLQSSLERACKTFKFPLKDADVIETQLLREFRRKYFHFAGHIPEIDDTLEWLSLMQHYGAPTRLLDFTYSIYVACYFAIEDAENNSVVWAINGPWANKCSGAVFRKNSSQQKFLQTDITEKNAKDFNPTFMSSHPKIFACPVNPFRLNERIIIQKGVFVAPGNVKIPFEENLKAMPRWDKPQNILKLIIKKEVREKALESLSNMNISRASLFPGLEGFAQSLRISVPKRWD